MKISLEPEQIAFVLKIFRLKRNFLVDDYRPAAVLNSGG
jgi:hypothetical protein